jgi:hypothetical protein
MSIGECFVVVLHIQKPGGGQHTERCHVKTFQNLSICQLVAIGGNLARTNNKVTEIYIFNSIFHFPQTRKWNSTIGYPEGVLGHILHF